MMMMLMLCVVVDSGGQRALSAAAVACVTGTTSTDSLSVALGSTFGAFLAPGPGPMFYKLLHTNFAKSFLRFFLTMFRERASVLPRYDMSS